MNDDEIETLLDELAKEIVDILPGNWDDPAMDDIAVTIQDFLAARGIKLSVPVEDTEF